MVEVFKTNVQEAAKASELKQLLLERFPEYRVNFDLEDCDKILRVESTEIKPESIVATLIDMGFFCEVLLD